MRHVAVMTATGSIGLIAIFAVDVLSLFWVSRLGVDSYKAAIGYASQLSFILMSINIGLTIAISANVSRALGAGDRPRARRMAASGLLLTTLVSLVLSAILWWFRDAALDRFMHARGRGRDGRQRPAGDHHSRQHPDGARHGLFRHPARLRRRPPRHVRDAFRRDRHRLHRSAADFRASASASMARPGRRSFRGSSFSPSASTARCACTISSGGRASPRSRRDLRPLMGIGLPSILANLATPVSAIYVTRVWSDFGEPTVAGGAIVDRVIPLAFGVIFALTGSIGPIIGQNYGARLMPRVRRALTDSFILAVGYALVAWAALASPRRSSSARFEARGDSARFRHAVLPLWRDRLGVHHLPVRRQHRLQQSGLRLDGDAVQLGPRDARHDPVRHHRREARRRAGRDDRPGLGAAIFGLGAVAAAYFLVGRLARDANPG